MAQDIVALPTLIDVIDRALARWPEHAARIRNAAQLLILGHVTPMAPGEYAVKSQHQPHHQSYAVTAESCACKDRERHPERACKHQMAVRLLEIAQERQRRLDAAERFAVLTDAERRRLTAWKKKYAAQSAGMGV